MNKKILLTKFFVKNTFTSLSGNKKSNLPKTIALILLLVVLMSMPFTGMIAGMYDLFAAIGKEEALLSLLYTSGTTLVLLFGIFTVLNIFYFSDDIEVFLPMPFKSSDIVFAKFMAVVSNMAIYASILLIPLIVFGIKSDSGILYYVYMIISLALVTVFPLVISSLLCLIIMRVVPLTKHKEKLKTIVGVIVLIFAVLINIVVRMVPEDESFNQNIANSISSNSALYYVRKIFIINDYITKSLVNSSNINGLFYILLAIIISIGLFLVYYYLGGKIYLKSVIGLSETYSKRKKISYSNSASKFKSSSAIKAIMLRDLKVTLRTSQFFINCIAMIIYMPAILIVCFFTNSSVYQLKNAVIDGAGKYDGLFVSIIFAFFCLCATCSRMANTSLSREGKDFFVSKYIPVDYKIQTKAKIYLTILVNSINNIIIAGVIVYINVGIIPSILAIIASIAALIMISLSQMYFDYKSPNFDWQDEKQLLKGNYIPLVSSLVMLAISGALIVLSLLISNGIIITFIIVAIDVIPSIVFYKKIFKCAEKIYNN